MTLMSWTTEGIAATAELPCKCATIAGLTMCSSCHARWHIMEESYGSINAGEIAIQYSEVGTTLESIQAAIPEEKLADLVAPKAKEMFDYEIDISNNMVKIQEGIWVPIDEVENIVTDPQEVEAIIEAYCDAHDNLPFEVPSLERPD